LDPSSSDQSCRPKSIDRRASRTIQALLALCKSKTNEARQQFLHQTQEIPSRQYEPRNDFSLYHYSLPFRFVIPQQLVTLPPGPCEHFCDLPPSFQHGATYQAPGDSHIFMQPLISYSLNAVILFPPRPGRPHIESRITRRNISITPLSRLAPPLEIGHLQQKYSLFSAQAIKAHYWTRSLGVLEVSGMEPSPLNMLARTPRAASNLSLRLKFKPEQEFAMHVRPFEWTFLVEHSIVARTSYCTRLIGDPFDTREGNRKPYMRTVDEVVTSERRLLNNASWRLDRISDLGTISPSATPSWVTSLSLPVTARKSLIPTFTTLLGARRYCLKVKLTISNLHHTPLEVQLPLQVYFESNQDSGQVSDRQGGQAHTQNDLCDIPMNPDAPNEVRI